MRVADELRVYLRNGFSYEEIADDARYALDEWARATDRATFEEYADIDLLHRAQHARDRQIREAASDAIAQRLAAQRRARDDDDAADAALPEFLRATIAHHTQ